MKVKIVLVSGILICLVFLFYTGFVLGYCLNCPPPSFSREKVNISFFYYKNDLECARTFILLKSFVTNYPYFELSERDMSIPEVREMREMINEIYLKDKSKSEKVPAIFMNGKFLVGYKEISEELTSILNKEIKDQERISSSIEERMGFLFRRLRFLATLTLGKYLVLAVSICGLIDGVNPCSLALLIFLISFLSVRKKTSYTLPIGLGFIVGTFIIYFLIGFGLLRFIRSTIFISVSKWIYLIIGTLSIVLGIISLVDIYFIKKKRVEDTLLQLPRSLKVESHNIIRYYLDTSINSKFIAGAIVGALSSIIEFFCTGQIYLPTLSIIEALGVYKFSLYLLFYNIMFVIPLLLVVLISNSWFSSIRLSSLLSKNLILVKILNAVLFFTLGLYLIGTT